MAYVNKQFYLEKKTTKVSTRNWWFIRWDGEHLKTRLGFVNFPKSMAGKRVRFKVEIVED